MRKHKSVVAILLAVMMIFTFMPTMAFAGSTAGTWDATYSYFTPTGGSAIAATKVGPASETGVVTANAKFGDVDETVYYVDLKDAKVVQSDGTAFGANVSVADYNALIDSKDVSVKAKVGSAFATGYGVTGWKFTVSGTKIAEDFVGSQDVTLAVAKETTTSGDVKVGDAALPALLNAESLELKLHVIGSSTVVSPDKNHLYFDAEGKKQVPNASAVSYIGEEQTLYIKDATNYNESYEKFNTSTAGWDAVPTITVNEVKEYGKFRGVYTNKTNATDVQYTNSFVVKVVSDFGHTPTITFDADVDGYLDAAKTQGYFAVDSLASYNPVDFVKVVPYESASRSRMAISEAITKANEAELMNYFADFYTIEKTDKKAEPGVEKLTFKTKYTYNSWNKLTSAEKEAYTKKYEQLFANLGVSFDYDAFVDTSAVTYAKETTIVNDKDDDISFEGQTKFVYSGKKTTKKGVLKSKKTITVKAAADSGNAITYVATKTAAGKIVVSKAGKITVKKGLKKGTYKVTVKAKTAAGNGYKAAKEKQTYTIVIKK